MPLGEFLEVLEEDMIDDVIQAIMELEEDNPEGGIFGMEIVEVDVEDLENPEFISEYYDNWDEFAEDLNEIFGITEDDHIEYKINYGHGSGDFDGEWDQIFNPSNYLSPTDHKVKRMVELFSGYVEDDEDDYI